MFLTSFVFILSPVVAELTVDRYSKSMFQILDLIKQISVFRCLHIINLINVLSTAYFIHVFLILHQHGDTVSKPGPKNKQVKSLPRCHLSAISLQSKNLSKIP